MPEILSLDMDWFNHLRDKQGKRIGIPKFFANLKESCVLPKRIDIVPEHQYLYPWSLKFVIRGGKLNITNLDAHHDFYGLSRIENAEYKRVAISDPTAMVGCWNFFAFMVHYKLIRKYVWVTSRKTEDEDREKLLYELSLSDSPAIRKFNRIVVTDVSRVFDMVHGKKFDGFIIVRSPGYTFRRGTVYHTVDQSLASIFPKSIVSRYTFRTPFKHELLSNYTKAFGRFAA